MTTTNHSQNEHLQGCACQCCQRLRNPGAQDVQKKENFFRGSLRTGFSGPVGGSIRGAGDLVGESADPGDDLIGFGGGKAHGVERFEEVFYEKAEVGGGDAASVVDLGQGATGVVNRTAEGHAKELALHGVQGVDLGVTEEGGQLRVSEHPGVEGGDEGVDHCGTADSVVESLHKGVVRVRVEG